MRSFVLCLVALLSAAFCLNAQESRATISGLVTDSSGAAVPDAQVSAINLETGLTVKSQANGQGLYVIPYLLPGQYKIQVERTGFKSFDQSPIILRGPRRDQRRAASRADDGKNQRGRGCRPGGD